jgi:hypothetical protein
MKWLGIAGLLFAKAGSGLWWIRRMETKFMVKEKMVFV